MSSSDRIEVLVNWIDKHPKSSVKDIAMGLGWNKAIIYLRLYDLEKLGLVVRQTSQNADGGGNYVWDLG